MQLLIVIYSDYLEQMHVQWHYGICSAQKIIFLHCVKAKCMFFLLFFCCGRLGHCHWLGGYVFKVCPIQVR